MVALFTFLFGNSTAQTGGILELHGEASWRRSCGMSHCTLDILEGRADVAALRFIEGRFSQKQGEELMQFAKLLSR